MSVNLLTVILVVSIAVIFSGIGILLILLHQRNKRKSAESLSWPQTMGTVVQSRVAVGSSVFGSSEDQDDGQPMYSPDIRYTYQVSGVAYTSDRISFGGKSSQSKPDKAQVVVAQYPEGSSVRVYYNPEKHQEAVLEQTSKGSGVLLVAGIVFLSIGIITLVVGLLVIL